MDIVYNLQNREISTRPEGAQFEKGHWYEPTILTEATNEMEIMREEVFGVVSPIMRISSYDEAFQTIA